MNETKTFCEIQLVDGVEGGSLYLDDFRIAGSKPWGGGKVRKTWNLTIENILTAIADNQKEKKKIYRCRYNQDHKITIEKGGRG